MKIALVLAKGVEGCGLTRHTIEFYNWLIKEGHEATIYSATEKVWPRQKTTDIVTTYFKRADIPKIAKETNTGPMVVPTLLIPPAKLNRKLPVDGSPMLIAKGLAAICCSANPIPTVDKLPSNKGNEDSFAAGINNKVPNAEMTKPNASPLR